MDPIQAAVDTVLPSTKFQIFSGILKASRSSDGKMRLHGVASSTTKDLHGDTMVASALEDMERAANNNLTIFLNHSYEVPEDVAGSAELARMKTRGVDGAGNPNYDLDMDILINDANPRAVKAFEAIEKGTKLGLSIGALIPEGGARKEKGGNYIIDHVELLETSLVGIPANPRSWVEYAAKSLRGIEKDAVTMPLGQPTLTLDGQNYRIEGSMEGLQLNSTTTTIGDVSQTFTQIGKATTWIETRDGDKITIGDPAEPADDKVENDVEPDITDAACPTCGKSKNGGGDCTDAYHKSIEPDVTDAQVTIIQIDTNDGNSSSDAGSSDAPASQEGPTTDPETGDGGLAASGEDVVTKGAPDIGTFKQMSELLLEVTRELTAEKTRTAELTASLTEITRERDTALAQRDQVLSETGRVLNRLAATPLMRRTVVAEAQAELRTKFGGVYDEGFLKLLENRNG